MDSLGDPEEIKEGEAKESDPFDTRIFGPWMKRWPIKNHNRHTNASGGL